jgi:hypothetical protein
MKKAISYIIILSFVFVLSSCSLPNSPKNSLGSELKEAGKIVFINKKESTLKFTVLDPKVIDQIGDIIGRGRTVSSSPEVEADYDIKFSLPGGRERVFSYWIGASEYGKDANFCDDSGNFYMIPEAMDSYIVNSTRMFNRPKSFTNLYTSVLTKTIELLDKNKEGETVVGIDIESDKKIRKYMSSFEQEKIMSKISSVKGFDVVPLTGSGKYDYSISLLTNIYKPDKAEITVEVLNNKDQTKKTIIFECKYMNDTWAVSQKKEE